MFSLVSQRGLDPDHLHVAELFIQCGLAREANRHLAGYMQRQVDRQLNNVEPHDYSAIQVMAYCTCFLSAVATISKILYPSDAGIAAQSRGARLRARLGIIALPHIESRGVRNSYEHVDERLDRLSKQSALDLVCLVDISRERNKDTLVLKKLDPVAGTIEFLEDVISIAGCMEEIEGLDRTVCRQLTGSRA